VARKRRRFIVMFLSLKLAGKSRLRGHRQLLLLKVTAASVATFAGYER
jgi:hypothetical protein